MRENPLVSVIVPLYNKERWIRRCIDSILTQSYKNLEILVVNDGSTDSGLEVVQGIDNEHIRVIEKANGGVSSARNRGIEEAKGEFIAFLDADDVWFPKHIEVLVEGFTRYPDAVILANRLVYRFEGDGKKRHEHAAASLRYETLDYIAALGNREFPIHIGSTMFKTSLLHEKHLRFNESMRLAEDINFMLRASRFGTIISSNYKGLVYYQDDAQSAMKQKAPIPALVPDYFDGMQDERWSESEKRQIRRFLFREYMKKAYQNRGLPFRNNELSTELGGSGIDIGTWAVVPYFLLRHAPEILFLLYRKMKNTKKLS